jgi:hypothetical protein
MKYSVEIGLFTVICIPSFRDIVSGILYRGYTDAQTGSYKPVLGN